MKIKFLKQFLVYDFAINRKINTLLTKEFIYLSVFIE